MTKPPGPATPDRSARFVGLVRSGGHVGARVEYARPEGRGFAIEFRDTESLSDHISTLQSEGQDTAEEHAALSALITEAGKKI